MVRYLGAICVCLLSAGSAEAQSIQFGGSRSYTVAPGKTIKLGQHYLIRNCVGTGVPTVKIVTEPTLGTLEQSIVQTRVDTGVKDNSGRSLGAFEDCVGKPVQAVEVRYTAGAARGTDYVAYQMLFNGRPSMAEIQIKVR